MDPVSNQRLQPSASSAVRRLDTIAIWLSTICAVHCVATPVLLLTLPLLTSEAFDDGLRISIAGLGVVAVGVGVALHKNFRALPPLGLGLAFLLASALAVPNILLEVVFSLVAAVFLITAHRRNSKACRATCPDCAGSKVGLS